MNRVKKRIWIPILSVALAAAAALVLCLPLLPAALTVRGRDGRLLWANPTPGSGFTIAFTHSANKGAITESYRFLTEGGFTLETATFESYGAGMLDQLPVGVTMEEEGDRLRLFFPPAPMEALSMIPGEIADHTLWGEGYSVNLANLSAYSGISIQCESISFLELLSQPSNGKF